MAYLLRITVHLCDVCGRRGPSRVATQELYNNRNALMGRYCDGCAQTRLQEQQRDENRAPGGNHG